MAGKKHGGLGKGIEAFFSDAPKQTATTSTASENKESKKTAESGKIEGYGELVNIRLSKIEPDKNQPRKNFDEAGLKELAASIKEHGLIEPLSVRKEGDVYFLINGERRWRACRKAGIKEVPCIVTDLDEKKRAIVALIDNIQREDLNPIEEAMAYEKLIEDFGFKQDEVAKQVSKSRTAVTNLLRLLKLSEPVREMVVQNKLSMGQARALLAVEDADLQLQLAEKIEEEDLSVREVEKLIKNLGKEKPEKKPLDPSLLAIYKDLESKMSETLGMKVNVKSKSENAGKIEISYSSSDDFEKLMDKLMT